MSLRYLSVCSGIEATVTRTAMTSRHTADNPDWITPAPIVEAARAFLGGIDLDPASDAEAQAIVQAWLYFDEEKDGLQQDWFGNVFLNPPGGQVNAFWAKLVEEFRRGKVRQAIWIGYSLEQLQTLQSLHPIPSPMAFPICVTAKRIAFVENAAMRAARVARLIARGEAAGATTAQRRRAEKCRAGHPPPNAPSHSNYVSYLGREGGEGAEAFARVFGQFGVVRL